MNSHYEAAAKAVKGLNKNVGALWPALVMFAVESAVRDASNPGAVPSQDLKPKFKDAEKQAGTEMKVEMGKNSTYRVQKGVIVQAIAKGVALVDGNGKPRGKTDVENELADLKVKKPAIDRFKTAMNTVNTIADELTQADCVSATALVNDLLKKVSAAIMEERKAA